MCQGAIVGHLIAKSGKQEVWFEVCAGHAPDFLKATLAGWLIRKGFSVFGMPLKGVPRFEFKYL
jgi:hypothetical protein